VHAYLIIGKNPPALEDNISKLFYKLKAKPMPFPLAKIEDVRTLEAFTKLTIDKPTAIVIKNFESATVPAQNAFLKNLEEPQENLTYILTAASERALLPTITSRCQIIRLAGTTSSSASLKDTVTFLKMGPGQKLSLLDGLRTREEAIAFIENLITNCHRLLLKTRDKHLILAKYIKAANKTLSALKANGNVLIQLTNLVVETSKIV
jgi:hypothetical protein